MARAKRKNGLSDARAKHTTTVLTFCSSGDVDDEDDNIDICDYDDGYYDDVKIMICHIRDSFARGILLYNSKDTQLEDNKLERNIVLYNG